MRVFAKNCGKPEAKKQKRHKQGPYENGILQHGLEKTGPKCRLWQGTIGHGHGGWNDIGKVLYFNGAKNLGGICQNRENLILRRNWFEVRANEQIQE